MQITRSTFLTAVATVTATLALGSTDLLAARPATDPGDVDLRNAVGQTFRARGAGGTLVALRLERVEEMRSDTTVEQFRLVFSSEDGYRLVEGTWRLSSATGRSVGDVFLIPSGTNAEARDLYRADFCLLTKIVPDTPRP